MRQWALVIVFALFLFAMLFALSAFVKGSGLGNEFSLPLLAIAGVMALLGSLAVVAVSFSLTSMSDRTQALGLPNGSVRAVIALSLVVLFAILTVYLFSALHDGGPTKTVACLDSAHKEDFVHSLRPDQVIGVMENRASAGGMPCADKPPLYMVYFRDIPNPASEDFAKQLLVLIGALVTTLSGFYFGSKASSDAQAGAAVFREAPPVPSAVEPAVIGRDLSGPIMLTISGSHLNSVKQVQIASGDRRYTDGNVVSNAGEVQARFAVPPDERFDRWDLVLTDALGRQARLSQSLDMGAKPVAAVPFPLLKGIDPMTFARTAPVRLSLSTEGLGDIVSVDIASATSKAVVQDVTARPKGATATVTFPTEAADGTWDVVVTDASGGRATGHPPLAFTG